MPPVRKAQAATTKPSIVGKKVSSSSQSEVGTQGSNEGSNIQVVVRCRGVAPNEQDLPLIASTSKTRGISVTLVNPARGDRVYHFGERLVDGKDPAGNVFGPEADQGMLFEDVARPILNQTLQGYNCTIFAYGQTGTGKTHTMEGDLTSFYGTFSTEAGIIPRMLYSLFEDLNSMYSEYRVTVSFVELYNEELRDLNASDYVDSIENTDKARAILKMYDEKNGSGVVVQNLEETTITTAEEGLAILKRGSERRQIAATKCNERSSRSHSIFTATVQMKETSRLNGDEVVKTGKLNLVDLAGSESIGRSGAQDLRAREAGMINVSLLSLGRVISKLAEKQSHIPYRESKLTRLLQDSLGGRTKTTIIATINSVNFEETSSTLDYAYRAKSITNRPQMNEKMPKTATLNQLSKEIQRLKADVNAAREQNGIYVSPESWEDYQNAHAAMTRELNEHKKSIRSGDDKLKEEYIQHENTQRKLQTAAGQLKHMRAQIEKQTQETAEVQSQLDATKALLETETARVAALSQSVEAWEQKAHQATLRADELEAKLAYTLAQHTSTLTALSHSAENLSADVSDHVEALTGRVSAAGERLRTKQTRLAHEATSALGRFAELAKALHSEAAESVHDAAADAEAAAARSSAALSRLRAADAVALARENETLTEKVRGLERARQEQERTREAAAKAAVDALTTAQTAALAAAMDALAAAQTAAAKDLRAALARGSRAATTAATASHSEFAAFCVAAAEARDMRIAEGAEAVNDAVADALQGPQRVVAAAAALDANQAASDARVDAAAASVRSRIGDLGACGERHTEALATALEGAGDISARVGTLSAVVKDVSCGRGVPEAVPAQAGASDGGAERVPASSAASDAGSEASSVDVATCEERAGENTHQRVLSNTSSVDEDASLVDRTLRQAPTRGILHTEDSFDAGESRMDIDAADIVVAAHTAAEPDAFESQDRHPGEFGRETDLEAHATCENESLLDTKVETAAEPQHKAAESVTEQRVQAARPVAAEKPVSRDAVRTKQAAKGLPRPMLRTRTSSNQAKPMQELPAAEGPKRETLGGKNGEAQEGAAAYVSKADLSKVESRRTRVKPPPAWSYTSQAPQRRVSTASQRRASTTSQTSQGAPKAATASRFGYKRMEPAKPSKSPVKRVLEEQDANTPPLKRRA